jgi:hypothetical protein
MSVLNLMLIRHAHTHQVRIPTFTAKEFVPNRQNKFRFSAAALWLDFCGFQLAFARLNSSFQIKKTPTLK